MLEVVPSYQGKLGTRAGRIRGRQQRSRGRERAGKEQLAAIVCAPPAPDVADPTRNTTFASILSLQHRSTMGQSDPLAGETPSIG